MDSRGRIVGFKSPVNTLFSLQELLSQYRGLQYSTSETMTKRQKDSLKAYKGLVTKNGIIVERNVINKDSSGSTSGSNNSNLHQPPLPDHIVRNMIASSSSCYSSRFRYIMHTITHQILISLTIENYHRSDYFSTFNT